MLRRLRDVRTVEAWLAKIYTDAAYRAAFLEDPAAALASTRLTPEEQRQCQAVDALQLTAAAASFAAKRAACARGHRRGSGWAFKRLVAMLKRLRLSAST